MWTALVWLTFAGAVRAQAPADDPKKAAALEEARQHVAKAKVHYDLGEFKEAADEYIIVYRLRPIPAILFNVAQAYRQGGFYDKARQFYKSYLRESPDAKNRPMIEQAIKDMDEMLAKERRTKDKPPRGVQMPVESAQASSAGPPGKAPPSVEKGESSPSSKPPELAKEPQPGARSAAGVAPPGKAGAAPGPAAPIAQGTVVPAALSPRAPPAPQSVVSPLQRTLSYALAGTAVVLFTGGIASAKTASNYNDALLSGRHSTATANDLMSTGSSAGKLSGVLFAAGLVAAAGAGVLYFVPFSSGAVAGGHF